MKYNPKDNYCSFSPEGFFGVNHNFACYCHDRQYRNEVLRRKTRLQSDQHLRDTIYKKYAAADKKKIGFIVSRVYYYAVRIFAGVFWCKQ